MNQDDLIQKVVSHVVQGLTEKDFVESLEVGGKWWDVYRFTAPKGKGLIAFRLAPDGYVEVASMKRTMREIRKDLEESQN